MLRNKARRVIEIGNDTCLLGFGGRDSVDTMIFDTSTISPRGVTEVQTLSTSGVPTGGTIKLVYNGQTTAAIAFNATAATIQAELRKLSRLGAVTVTGGPLTTNPVVITFTGKNANRDVPLITTTANALTGGSTPAASVTETTKGDATFAGMYELISGTPLMVSANDSKMVQEWDGSSATTLIGIFDGQRELFGPDDYVAIPVYNTDCVFDKDVVKNYATWAANYNTWAAAALCKFKSQGV